MFVNIPARFLLELGFFPQHSGFGYLVYAIGMICSDPMGYYSGKTDVFAELGKEYDVSVNCAKRCMHYSIQSAWHVPGNNTLRGYFASCSKNCPPSLGEFMCRVALELNDRYSLAPEAQQVQPWGAIDSQRFEALTPMQSNAR
ncbi:MAG: hypothetical protein IKZ82_01980 [Clostridia bacterium]|nr:hypothetical protein [Clostridia bacterium]